MPRPIEGTESQAPGPTSGIVIESVHDTFALAHVLGTSDRIQTVAHGPRGSQWPIRTQNVTGSASFVLGFLEGSKEYWVGLVSQGQVIDPIFFETPPPMRQWASVTDAIVHPGNGYDLHEGSIFGGPGGTGGWILRDATNATLYQLTAGHAPFDVGETILVNGTPIGVVAAKEFGDVPTSGGRTGESDWLLVRLNESVRPWVTPSVSHWGGPTRILQPENATEGRTVCWFGMGQVTWNSPELRHRCGQGSGFTENRFYFSGITYTSDSGSPVLDYESGQAIGILTRLGQFANGASGSNLCFILERARLRLFDLALATAPYEPPIADTTYPGASLNDGQYTCPTDILAMSQH